MMDVSEVKFYLEFEACYFNYPKIYVHIVLTTMEDPTQLAFWIPILESNPKVDPASIVDLIPVWIRLWIWLCVARFRFQFWFQEKVES